MKRPFPILEVDPSMLTVEGAREDASRTLATLGIASQRTTEYSDRLAPEQIEELESLSLGKTPKERAAETGSELNEVLKLRRRTAEDLGANGNVQAVRIAIVAGIIPIEFFYERNNPRLDQRVQTVVALMSLGISNSAIAKAASLPPATVRREISEAKRDLGAENPPHLVRRAFEARALKDPAKQHFLAIKLKEFLELPDVDFPLTTVAAVTRSLIVQKPTSV